MNVGAKDAILFNCFVAQSVEATKVRPAFAGRQAQRCRSKIKKLVPQKSPVEKNQQGLYFLDNNRYLATAHAVATV